MTKKNNIKSYKFRVEGKERIFHFKADSLRAALIKCQMILIRCKAKKGELFIRKNFANWKRIRTVEMEDNA